jgi:hypothetical protein
MMDDPAAIPPAAAASGAAAIPPAAAASGTAAAPPVVAASGAAAAPPAAVQVCGGGRGGGQDEVHCNGRDGGCGGGRDGGRGLGGLMLMLMLMQL